MAGSKIPGTKSVSVEVEHVKEESPMTTDLAEELSSTRVTSIKDEAIDSAASSPSLHPTKVKTSRSSSSSTNLSKSTTNTSIVKKQADEMTGHATPKMESEVEIKPLKTSRSAKSQPVPRIAALFDQLPDATAEATSTFALMESCTYSNKYLGYTEHAMECDCSEEWDASTKTNDACGEDSDCINRATKMECVGDCACGPACQNQRFQRREYANVSVIKTEKKGHGLRANTDLRAGDFVFEYIGEVINEPQFRRRMLAYDDQGIKHFYFMSLSKGEFVDATKKGNLGRFCNHSCNPNCYVDKWVVGDKLRMGIFAEKKIKAGEELVFNYNVDRYGANPQPCYCGESNCTGFIGGKTQTERATKLSAATIEALGIEDADSWDTVVAKKPKKKKSGEDDEDYVESVEAKELEADGVTKVMAALMQCKEKWIAVKLLQRIQRCKDEQVRNRVVKVHGYQILNSQLAAWKEDENVVLQILDILDQFPRITRNKIVDSKIETTLQPFTSHQDERVSETSKTLLESWARLEVAYRIPRKKRELEDAATPTKREAVSYDRRESSRHERKRSRSRTRSISPPRGPSGASIPSGPKSSLPQRNQNYYQPRPPPPRFPPPTKELPPGWFEAKDKTGKVYYYNSRGSTTWQRPTLPAIAPPPPPKAPSQQDVLKNIIDNIVTAKEKDKDTKDSTPETPKDSRKDKRDKKDKKDKKEKKWESYDEEKKKKLYENTLFPHISHVMNKYKHKIPKDDLKRFAKDISKKLSASDFKAGRVKDPTKLDEKHIAKVKKFCKDFFDKAAYKHKKHEQAKASRKPKSTNGDKSEVTSSTASPAPVDLDASPDIDDEVKKEDDSDDEDVKMYDDGDSPSPKKEHTNGDISLKRKRLRLDDPDFKDEDEDLTKSPFKKPNLSETGSPPPPPPPPGPPVEIPPHDVATPEPQEADMPDIHADTSFKVKSMADVLAEAQADEEEEDMETSMETANQTFMQSVMKQEMGEMNNPLVEGQQEAIQLGNIEDEIEY